MLDHHHKPLRIHAITTGRRKGQVARERTGQRYLGFKNSSVILHSLITARTSKRKVRTERSCQRNSRGNVNRSLDALFPSALLDPSIALSSGQTFCPSIKSFSLFDSNHKLIVPWTGNRGKRRGEDAGHSTHLCASSDGLSGASSSCTPSCNPGTGICVSCASCQVDCARGSSRGACWPRCSQLQLSLRVRVACLRPLGSRSP